MSENSGHVCPRHEQWCPDGVCPYCEPSLFTVSARSLAQWPSAHMKPVTAISLIDSMIEAWKKIGAQQEKPRSRMVSTDWWQRAQDAQNGVKHSPECEERWAFWRDRIDFWPKHACDYRCPSHPDTAPLADPTVDAIVNGDGVQGVSVTVKRPFAEDET